MQHIGMLNLRIGDMMTQLNVVLKALMEENTVLRRENSQLKEQQTDEA
jgi:regulator of replication initiation timing